MAVVEDDQLASRRPSLSGASGPGLSPAQRRFFGAFLAAAFFAGAFLAAAFFAGAFLAAGGLSLFVDFFADIIG